MLSRVSQSTPGATLRPRMTLIVYSIYSCLVREMRFERMALKETGGATHFHSQRIIQNCYSLPPAQFVYRKSLLKWRLNKAYRYVYLRTI